MDTSESRKFLKRYPAIEETAARILYHKGIDFKDEEIYNWSIRTVRMPAEFTNNGEITIGKLFIDNEFVINIYPMTKELEDTINQLYPIPVIRPKDQDVEPIPQ